MSIASSAVSAPADVPNVTSLYGPVGIREKRREQLYTFLMGTTCPRSNIGLLCQDIIEYISKAVVTAPSEVDFANDPDAHPNSNPMHWNWLVHPDGSPETAYLNNPHSVTLYDAEFVPQSILKQHKEHGDAVVLPIVYSEDSDRNCMLRGGNEFINGYVDGRNKGRINAVKGLWYLEDDLYTGSTIHSRNYLEGYFRGYRAGFCDTRNSTNFSTEMIDEDGNIRDPVI